MIKDALDRLSAGQFAVSYGLFRQAVLTGPRQAVAWFGLSQASARLPTAADKAFAFAERALLTLDGHERSRLQAEVFKNFGQLLQQRPSQAHRPSAKTCFQQAVIIAPSLSSAMLAFAATAAPTDRRKWLGRALKSAPARSNSGEVAGELRRNGGDIIAAKKCYRRALILTPSAYHSQTFLGIAQKSLGDLITSTTSLQRAVIMAPSYLPACATLGRNYLLQRDFKRGWEFFEAEWRHHNTRPDAIGHDLPLWTGVPIPNGQLLLWSDDQIGDEVLFANLLPALRKHVGSLTVAVDRRIVPYLAAALPAVEFIAKTDQQRLRQAAKTASAGYRLEFIGRFLLDDATQLPPPQALLKSTPIMPPERKRPRVGLSFHSINPTIGDYKSIHLTTLSPLLCLPGIDWVNLQYGDHEQEISSTAKALGIHIEQNPDADQIQHFDEFLKRLATIDLVISIPNTTVHLAGAMGIETWVMLPRGPGQSWFWFDDGEQASWYPKTRIFRQKTPLQWDPVVTAVRDAMVDRLP